MSTNANPRPQSSRRTFLTAGAASVIGGSAAGALASATSTPDPIFAALAAERAAEDRWCELGNWPTGTPELCAAGMAAFPHDGNGYQALFRRTMATVPTTPAGLVALVDRFEKANEGCCIETSEHGLTELLATVRTFATGKA